MLALFSFNRVKLIAVIYVMLAFCLSTYAASIPAKLSIDRLQLVTQQINLLKSRLNQSEHELGELRQQYNQEVSDDVVLNASKNLLNKAKLDILVNQSNLDSINIEITDCQQAINWLEKNIQEIQNQLDVFNVFGLKAIKNEAASINELHTDLSYQTKLLNLEKIRIDYLHQLQKVVSDALSFKNDHYKYLDNQLKSRKMMLMKQQQVNDELAYQEQQNYWLQELSVLSTRISQIDPIKSRERYASTERDIFYANENANYAYTQSLIARYKDQVQQMKLAVFRTNSISLLNQMSDQVQALNKQISRLEDVLKSRTKMLEQHVADLSHKNNHSEGILIYSEKLSEIVLQYKVADKELNLLAEELTKFRSSLDKSLQYELSARQGLPIFELKTLIEIGREVLRVPTLTFQITKNVSTKLINGFQAASWMKWTLFALIECLFIFTCIKSHQIIANMQKRSSLEQEKINSRWLSAQWTRRHFIDLAFIANICGLFWFFGVPSQNYFFIIYLTAVWLVFKSIKVIAHLCLVEATQDTTGHDARLYRQLKWIIAIAGVITAVTVFVHLLPLVYELKTLCNRLFLLLMMVVSLLLLRSWDIAPNLILSHSEASHPYLQKSIRLIGILVPLLMFANSVIGLFGYLNLIMTVSWYEGIFLIILVAYLITRGLLSDGMEQLYRWMIQYVNNGWLWTEAFLKPLDKILRIALFFGACGVLFLLYGWDQQSPVVQLLIFLVNYKLASILNTSITPLRIIELAAVIAIFYWTAKWTREFVYRLLLSRTKDMGLRNSIAILSQYTVVMIAVFTCLRLLGIDLQALAYVASAFAFGVGLGLRDLANNFASGFLILLERPLRVGDIVNINNMEGEVMNIGGRAITVRTWDHMELVVPNAEIFNKAFTNWTAHDNVVRTVTHIKIGRQDNPHEVESLIQNVLAQHKDVLKDPLPEVFLREMTESLMDFELRYYVNIRQVHSRTAVLHAVLMSVWDAFSLHGIKTPHPQREILLRREPPLAGVSDQIIEQPN